MVKFNDFFLDLVNKMNNSFKQWIDKDMPYIIYILETKSKEYEGELSWVLVLPNDNENNQVYNTLKEQEVNSEIDEYGLFIKNKEDDGTIEIADDEESYSVVVHQLNSKEEVKKYLNDEHKVKAAIYGNWALLLNKDKWNIKDMTVIELDYTDEFNARTKDWKAAIKEVTNNAIRILDDLESLFK